MTVFGIRTTAIYLLRRPSERSSNDTLHIHACKITDRSLLVAVPQQYSAELHAYWRVSVTAFAYKGERYASKNSAAIRGAARAADPYTFNVQDPSDPAVAQKKQAQLCPNPCVISVSPTPSTHQFPTKRMMSVCRLAVYMKGASQGGVLSHAKGRC